MKEDSVDIRVVQVPTEIKWECEACLTVNSIDYKEFTDSMGSSYPGDWEGQVLQCEECGQKYKIEDSEWD